MKKIAKIECLSSKVLVCLDNDRCTHHRILSKRLDEMNVTTQAKCDPNVSLRDDTIESYVMVISGQPLTVL